MGLVSQVVNPFMPGGNKRSKRSQTNIQLKTADLFKNVLPFVTTRHERVKNQNKLVHNIFLLATMIEIHFFMLQ